MRRLTATILALITAVSLTGCKGFDPGEGGPVKPKAQRIVIQVHITSVPSGKRVTVRTDLIGPGWKLCYDSHGKSHTVCNHPFTVTTPFVQTISVHTDAPWRAEIDVSTDDRTVELVKCRFTDKVGHELAGGLKGRFGAECTYFWEPS